MTNPSSIRKILKSAIIKRSSRWHGKKQDFLLFYSSDEDNGSLVETIHALYYLPQNYKLIVPSQFALRESVMPWADKKIMDRVQFAGKTGLSQPKETSPFSYNSVVVWSGGDGDSGAAEETPRVQLLDTADDIASDHHNGFTVAADNPEALATAVLRIARAGHA
jgi:hypothetical protein